MSATRRARCGRDRKPPGPRRPWLPTGGRGPRGARLASAARWIGLLLLLAPVPARAATDPMRAIAIAEDQRRYADGELRSFLGAAEPAVRARAALAVGRLQDSTSVPDLLPLVRDSSVAVRREVVFALGQIGQRSAVAAVESLLVDPDPEVVDLAIEALGKLGDRSATAPVADFLRSGSPRLRGEAAVALWRLADSTALERLMERHEDPDPGVRWRVLYALEKIHEPDRIDLIAALHLDDPDATVRAHAARTMGRQKSPRAIAYLIERLSDSEPAVVVNALRALQQIADSTCTLCASGLLGALGHPHPHVRVTAAAALGAGFALAPLDDAARRAALDSLAAHLRDRDAATRGTAARALLSISGEAALDRVAAVLEDSSTYARAALLEGLAGLPAARVVPLLLPRLAAGAAPLERLTAAEVLGSLGDAAALPPLRAGLTDSSLLFVAVCASALTDLGDTASVARLATAYAAHAADADPDARVSLRDALRSLAGGAFADSVERAHEAPPPTTTYAEDFEKPSPVRGAVLQTTAGEIEWAFYGEQATQTVKNFVRLAERGYFDGLAVHRVVPDFVIQDGDPTGTGAGGPGYTIRCEYNRLRYEPGMVGMALAGKDTGGSQWFITLSPQPHLNGRYTIFAHVTRGLDVARRVVQGDRVLHVELLR